MVAMLFIGRLRYERDYAALTFIGTSKEMVITKTNEWGNRGVNY